MVGACFRAFCNHKDMEVLILLSQYTWETWSSFTIQIYMKIEQDFFQYIVVDIGQ